MSRRPPHLCLALSLAAGLGACSAWAPEDRIVAPDPGSRLDTVAFATRRAYAGIVQDVPFDEGPVYVVAPGHDEMLTYLLVPCAAGAAICAGSAHGPRGQLTVTEDYYVVEGLYHRTFYLSPGGDGGVRRAGQADTWLAWEDAGDH